MAVCGPRQGGINIASLKSEAIVRPDFREKSRRLSPLRQILHASNTSENEADELAGPDGKSVGNLYISSTSRMLLSGKHLKEKIIFL
jgi:hypothetical protein